jgi:hypothetical protein
MAEDKLKGMDHSEVHYFNRHVFTFRVIFLFSLAVVLTPNIVITITVRLEPRN